MGKNRSLVLIVLLASFLRFYKLNLIPVSLFGDELDVGYHAYSILKTARDYSGNFLPLHFQSLAEWRTPLYLYSAVPTVWLFGITALGVRLPAAIFGILTIPAFYSLVRLIRKDFLESNKNVEIYGAFFLALSPWHIQYSRAAFEVTQLLLFLILGLYFFLYSLKNKGKHLWLAGLCFILTPWIYSTAKVFIPFFLITLVLLWGNKIIKFPKKELVKAIVPLFAVGLPLVYTILLGGGGQRFSYIGIFTDPTLEPEVGTSRLLDARARGEFGAGLSPTVVDRMFHNKVVFWGDAIMRNYFESLSANFLFYQGDPNPRHSIEGMGQFYPVEIVVFTIGAIIFISGKSSNKSKVLLLSWVVLGIFPASITRDGGSHATRLILILPPLIFFISFGFSYLSKYLKISYLMLLLVCITFYLHNFYVHNPFYSERWWHAGWTESIQAVKEIDKDYDTVVITMADEPAWIFFAANYEYDPHLWQQNFPIGNDVELDGFGKVSHIDKFHFGIPNGRGLYEWGQILNEKTLYLASAKEVKVNLIMEPERTPSDLNLIKSISYPSGEPAFYLFAGRK